MTSVIAGWRWAVLDASPPDLGQVAVGVAVAVVLFVVGLATFRSSEPTLRGHDLMVVAIEVDGLSKKYRLGEYQAAYGTLRETARPRGKTPHAAASTIAPSTEIWALQDVSFERSRGSRSSASIGTQRRREVDASQDPHAHRVADGRPGRDPRAASAACSRSGQASTRS